MNPKDFAYKHLGQFKQHGSEIIPTHCPYCGGGPHKDKGTFALNIDKLTYNCKRGNNCGKAGTFWQLCKDFGEEADKTESELYKAKPKEYKKPETIVKPTTDPVELYLRLRGFAKATWERRGIGDDGKGNIAMPYYDENGELVFMKFRPAHKVQPGEKKAWREKDGKPIFWGMNLCTMDKPLVIVEGEMDALALDEAGVPNVVSVPSGAQDLACIELCWDWLEKFDKVIIWGDNDDPGKEMVRNLILRLGEWKCFVVDSPWKDANVALIKEGRAKVLERVQNAKPIPVRGLIDLADVVPIDVSKIERARSNVPALDHFIGGFLMGELSVWTGKNGQGKSTFLGQMLLESVEDGKSVCAYSGELRADRFQYWINLQAAGRKNLESYFDQLKQKDVVFVPKEKTQQIREWYRGKFWLYDNNLSSINNEEYGIIKLFTYAVRKYGCKTFLVDNLMTSRFDQMNDDDYFRAQSNFVGDLIHFAKSYNVHVHLVAHPRKTKGRLSKEDVGGSGDITNRADNVFSIERADKASESCDTLLTILKNRSEGVQNEEIGLMFDQHSKRFWQPSDIRAQDKQYGWAQTTLGREVQIQCPWDS